jgi:hypothetical protein
MIEKVQTETTLFKPLFELLSEIRERDTISGSKKPQFALVESFWHIGRLIVENEQGGESKALYGDYLVERLAKELTFTFGKGYNQTNIRWARQLYLNYPIRHTTSDELDLTLVLNKKLSWSHYRSLLKITDVEERNFYIEKIAEDNWSVRFLGKMIEADFYMTRQSDFQLPSPTSQPSRATSLRLLKSGTKAIALRITGWAFIHPSSFLIDNKDLLFYHINKRQFIYLSHSKPVSGWKETLKLRLTNTYNQPADVAIYSFSEGIKLTLLAADNMKRAKAIQGEFNNLI